MITPGKLLAYLYQCLPTVTAKFGQDLSVVSARAESGRLVIVAPGHGLTVGMSVTAAGGELLNPIVSEIDNGDGSFRLETQFNHQLTEPRQPLDQREVEIGGQAYPIEAVPNRRLFEVEAPAGSNFVGKALVERLYNTSGYLSVVAVNGAEVVLQPAAGPVLFDAQMTNLRVSTRLKIAIADSIVRAQAIYAKQPPDSPFLFIIMGDVDVSKDRHTQTDAIAAFSAQDMRRLTLLQSFTIAVFWPTPDDIGAAKAQEAAYGEIYQALTKVFYGLRFKTEDSAMQYVTVSSGHGPGPVNTAYYVHAYEWQTPSMLTYESGVDGVFFEDVAFRDIDFTLDRDGAFLVANVDLDKEPL
jgi:hypothetical protein